MAITRRGSSSSTSTVDGPLDDENGYRGRAVTSRLMALSSLLPPTTSQRSRGGVKKHHDPKMHAGGESIMSSAVSQQDNNQPLEENRKQARDLFDKFSVAAGNSRGNYGKPDNAVPEAIANRIQEHHELWHRYAYGKSCDCPMSGGHSSVPTRSEVKPVPRARSRQGMIQITSWRSRPKPQPLDEGWSSPQQVEASPGQHSTTPLDYNNADDVVLNNTQDSDDRSVLQRDDVLPPGSPRLLVHPYNRRKVKSYT